MSTATTHIKTKKQLVPAIRFKEFEGDWTVSNIGNFVENHVGGASLKPSDFVTEEGYEVVPKKAVVSGGNLKLDSVNPTYCSKAFFEANERNIVDSSFLITVFRDLVPSGPSIGFIVRFEEDKKYILAQGVYGLKINENELESDFLIQFSNTVKYRRIMQRILVGSTQVHIRNQDFFKVELSNPSLPEQQKIASFLSAVDEKIQQLTKKKALLEQFKKGVMQQLFSGQLRFKDEKGNPYPDWEEKKISDICERSTGRSKSNEIVDDGRNIIVDMGAISRVGKLLGTKRTNCVEDYLETTDLVMAKDDIGGGQIIGKVVLVPVENKYILGDHVYKLKVIKGDVNFLYYSINSYAVNKSFRQKANGTAQIGINNKTVDDQLIPFPPIEEQQKIATYLSSIDTKIESVNNQITQTQTFKKGLLQQMFV